MMTYAYLDAPTKEVCIALWVLERHEWSWRSISSHGYIMRAKNTAKAASLVAHDRILNGELMSRGLPSFYGSNKK